MLLPFWLQRHDPSAGNFAPAVDVSQRLNAHKASNNCVACDFWRENPSLFTASLQGTYNVSVRRESVSE